MPTGESLSLSGRTVGQYRIGPLLGRGGMGEVYLATDERLRREVAIKVLPDRLAADGNARTRFLRESRLACKVVHPYVATVFDVVEYADRPLLVMERIDGLRFDDYVRGEQAGPEEVAALGLEIAEALAAIHRAGIVHRDLKPGNVLVTPEGHVKVTDFGVARSVPRVGEFTTEPADEMDSVTRTGVGVGTVAYMSPEQVRGDEVDGRSDLFALGIVLYEAVTGEHPFRRDSLLGTASAILRDPPGGGREHPTLTGSGPIRDVILRLLEKDPDLRYATAEIAADDLRAVVRGEGLRIAPRVVRRVTRVLVATGVVAAVAAAVVLLPKIFTPGGRGGGGPPPRPVIAVLPFEDETREPGGHHRAAMAADLLRALVSQSREVRAFDEERVLEALPSLEEPSSRASTLVGLQEALGPSWIVAGKIYREGDSWLAALDLYRPGAREPETSLRVTAARPSSIADHAAPKILSVIVPGAVMRVTAEKAGLMSKVEEAQLLLHRATVANRSFRWAESIRLLDRATDLDPSFALAWARLAEVRDSAGYGRLAREASATAIAAAASLPEIMKAEVRAVDAAVRDALDDEIAARRIQADSAPDNPPSHLALASALRRAGRHDEAEASIRRAEAVDPIDMRIPVALARVRLAQGRFSEALAALAEAERIGGERRGSGAIAKIERVRAEIQFAEGRYEDAAATYRRAAAAASEEGLPELAAILDVGIADCDLRRGRLREAESRYSGVVTKLRSIGAHRNVVVSLYNLGGALFVRGEFETAERVLREAVSEAGLVENPALGLGAEVNLASLLGYTGRDAESEQLAQNALETARRVGSHQHERLLLMIIAGSRRRQGHFTVSLEAYRASITTRDADAKSPRVAQARIGIAETLLDLGRTKESNQEAESAVQTIRRTEERSTLGYALVVLARTRAVLGDWNSASTALEEARAIAAESAMLDLQQRVTLANGEAALLRGETGVAVRSAEAVIDAVSKSGAPELEASGWVLLSRGHLLDNRSGAARSAAERVLRHPRALFVDRLMARITLAAAHAAEQRPDAAILEARVALEASERSGTVLLTAEAAATILEVRPRVMDSEAVRERGWKALEQYLEGVPEERSDVVRGRSDVVRLMRILNPRREQDETMNPERRVEG